MTAAAAKTPLDAATCYRALAARDLRFDGLFYVGVATTGIYCRPICPARTPGAQRCTFWRRAAEAERAGYRACFRCRPELAPGLAAELAAVDSIPRLVAVAAARIEAGFLNDHSIEQLAAELEVSARHLRRAMEAELGVSPVELAQSKRLALAKQLLADTRLPVTEVAFAAGFTSVRRFNALVRARFGRPPSALRTDAPATDTIPVRLDYRPPLDWPHLLSFLQGRAVPGVETVGDGEYQRHVRIADHVGTIAVRHHPQRAALEARVSLSLAPVLMDVVARLRSLFDLDARPDVIAAQLGRDRLLAPLLRARPGLRVPGAFDAFELAVRAVLGQQVSVKAATTLSGRLAQHFGAGVPALPAAAVLAAAPLAAVQALGLPASRARTLLTLARAVNEGVVDLGRGADPARTMAALQSLPGIGPWTAHYIAMRALRWPNAFPAGDLALRKALGVASPRAVEARAQAWQPWRAYAVMHLWNGLTQTQGG